MFFIVGFITILAFFVRLVFILRADFPLNDGGMFYVMIQDLLKENYRLPLYTTYNFDNIPYAYSPLSFYVTGFLHRLTGVPLIELLRFVPLIFSVLTIPVFYLVSLRILKSKYSALAALFVFVTIPRSFESLILGGGLTRSFGFLFALGSIYFAHKLYTERKKTDLLLTVFFLALTVLSHIENAAFAVITIILLYLIHDRTVEGFIKLAKIALGVLILTSPWYLSLFSNHGLAPFTAAVQSNPRNALTLGQVWLLSYVTEPKIQTIYTLFVIGLVAAILRRDYFLPLWFVLLLFSATRMIHLAIFVPISMLAGLAITEIILPGFKQLDEKNYKKNYPLIISVLVIAMTLSLLTAFGHKFTPLDSLAKDEKKAMEWISKNTNNEAKFLVVSSRPGWAWFLDATLEWFPAVAQRQSLTTVQGYEWLPGFSQRLDLNNKFKSCNDENIRCFEQFAKKENIAFTHIYISKSLRPETNWPKCCTLLINSLRNSKNYKLIYEGRGALVFAYED